MEAVCIVNVMALHCWAQAVSLRKQMPQNQLQPLEGKPSPPLVSIVMATYNGGLYLREQLDSVLAQTYPNLELVITDDGSTDDTVSILKEYAARFKHIRLLTDGPNVGYVKNFERGCLAAKGDFIALCDQDDWWHPQKIEKLVAAIGNASIVYSDSELCDERLQPTGVFLSDRAAYLNFSNCLQQAVFCRIYGHTVLMPKSFVQKAIPFLPVIPHDWWLSFVATLEGGIVYHPEALSKYRQHSSNVFGAVGSKSRKHNKADSRAKKEKEIQAIRERMLAFYERCPATRKEKGALRKLNDSYRDFSPSSNFKRMRFFFRYRGLLLASKKRSLLRQYLFCLKMFFIVK